MGSKSWIAGAVAVMVIAACSASRGDPDPGGIGKKAVAGAASALAAAGIPDHPNYGDSHWDHCSTMHASGWDPQSESMDFQTHLSSVQLMDAVGSQLLSRGWKAGTRSPIDARWTKTLSDGRTATVALSQSRQDAAGPLLWSFYATVPAAHHPIPNCA